MESALEPVEERVGESDPMPAEPERMEPFPVFDSPLPEDAAASKRSDPAPPAPLRAQLPRSLAFTGSPTIREFLDGAGPEAAILRLRMSEVRVPPQDQLFFAEYGETLNLVAVVGTSLPETAALLPLWVRIADACPRADLRVIGDDDLARLELLLNDDDPTDVDSVDVPMLFVFDEDYLLQAQWGPRPQAAEPWLDGWLAEHPELESLADSEDPQAQETLVALTCDLTLHMRVWYNSGLDAEASGEIRELLAGLHDESAESP